MRAEPSPAAGVRIDRVACSGHGVCHALDPERIALDEWGYPIPSQVVTDTGTAEPLVRLCPAAAVRPTTAG